MVSAVRAGDVYIVPIRGRNDEVKHRRVLVLDGAPDPLNPAVVLIVSGCSETNARARTGTYVRIYDDDSDFFAFGLENSTTFHIEDIAFYDAKSPFFADRPKGRCADPDRVIEFRELLDRRLDDPTPIPLLPRTASLEAEEAAKDYRRQAVKLAEPEFPRDLPTVAQALAKKPEE